MEQMHNQTAKGHETTDADVKPILRFLFGLFALIVVAMFAMTFFFDFLQQRYQQAAGEVSPLVDTRQIPPNPRLQVKPSDELQEVHNWEDQRLHSYGWVDKEAGVFRIPIDRAMEIVAESGLPARRKSPGSTGGSH